MMARTINLVMIGLLLAGPTVRAVGTPGGDRTVCLEATPAQAEALVKELGQQGLAARVVPHGGASWVEVSRLGSQPADVLELIRQAAQRHGLPSHFPPLPVQLEVQALTPRSAGLAGDINPLPQPQPEYVLAANPPDDALRTTAACDGIPSPWRLRTGPATCPVRGPPVL